MTKLLDPLRDLLAVDLHQLMTKAAHRAELFGRLLPNVSTDSLKKIIELQTANTRQQIDRLERALASLGDRADVHANVLPSDPSEEIEDLVSAEPASPSRDASLASLIQLIDRETISGYETIRLLAQRLALANIEDMATTAIDEESTFIDRLNHAASLAELPAQGAS